jgi:hypothetical protein
MSFAGPTKSLPEIRHNLPICLRSAHRSRREEYPIYSPDRGPLGCTPKTPQYNPLEKLPILIEEGSSVYEPHYILEYIETKYPDIKPMLQLVSGFTSILEEFRHK